MIDALRQVEGAYSLVALSQDGLIGVRDPLGVRPLVLGRLGDAWILASETCALDIIGADFVRDVEPGEMVIIGAGGVQQRQAVRRARKRLLHLRVHLFRAARQRGRRHQRLRGAEAHRRASWRARATSPPTSSFRCPDSGVPAAHRLCRGSAGCRSSSASSATIMSAAPSSSRPTRSAIWACKLKHNANRAEHRRQARDPGRRFDRARHHLDQDRRDGAPGRRARGAYAHLEPADHAIPASTASPRRSATSCSPLAYDVDGDGATSSAPTASPSSRSTGSTAPWASPSATPPRRNSATPASPAIIRSRWSTTTPARSRPSSRCSPRRA